MAVTKHKRKGKLGKLIHSCNRAISFHEVANKIESIKIINKEIHDNRNKYGIEIAESSGGETEAEVKLHKCRRYVEEDQVVGFGHDTEALVKQLIEGSLHLNFVSIIGMGGLGKTTLARKIYNDNHVKNHFDFHGWVYVSQEYKIRDMLIEILKGMTPMPKVKKFILKVELTEELLHGLEAKYSTNKDSMSAFVEGIYEKNGVGWQDLDEDELRSLLFDCLKDKRYLVVLDDIWEIEAWNEDIAEDYLEELIDWSLIQVATKRLDGGVKTCRIHDLLRDLCISESAEEKFLEVCSDVKLSPIGKCRRISIHFANHPYISSSSNPHKSSNNRFVIGFQGVVELESLLDKGYYLKWLWKSNKLVRVVELSNMAICCAIPKRIQNLFLLRYLRISSGLHHVIIPNSLCNLWNLETLYIRNSIIESLPKGLWKLQKLRHLYLNGPTSLPGTDNEEGLPNLQVLTGIALNHYTESLFAKARFPNLRKLGLCSFESRLLILSLSSIHPLHHLQTLKFLSTPNLQNGKIKSYAMDYEERCNAKASTFGHRALQILYDAPGRTMVLERVAGCGSFLSRSKIG
uniref:NB-ARC domain-containing protein n=1 Tax=Quercus lobata TaxID=97700 RepID=A0A7N2MYW3_QUELO